MLLLGIVGVALPQTLILVANQLAGPSIIAILSPAAPVSLLMVFFPRSPIFPFFFMLYKTTRSYKEG